MTDHNAATPINADDEAGRRWMDGVAWEWAADLADPCQDLYTLQDGRPEDGEAPPADSA